MTRRFAHTMRAIAATALLAFAIPAPPAVAQAPEKITVAIGIDFRPFEFLDDAGRASGLIADTWRLWSEKTGIPVEFVPAPWAETLEMMKDGRADVHAGLNVTDERQEYLSYGDPILTTNSFVCSPVGVRLSRSLDQLAGFRIGVLRGSLEESILQNAVPEAELVAFDTIDGLYDAVASRQVRLFADGNRQPCIFSASGD